jgi:hypothetical protein
MVITCALRSTVSAELLLELEPPQLATKSVNARGAVVVHAIFFQTISFLLVHEIEGITERLSSLGVFDRHHLSGAGRCVSDVRWIRS